MPLSHEQLLHIFERYHGFDDGLLLSFEYFYQTDKPLSAKVILLAQDHAHPEKTWMKVTIKLEDVGELVAKVKGLQFNAISSSVKLLKFGSWYCIDIDGEYELSKHPESMDSVRKHGDCYVTAKKITIAEEKHHLNTTI